jgi:hypothetical protein
VVRPLSRYFAADDVAEVRDITARVDASYFSVSVHPVGNPPAPAAFEMNVVAAPTYTVTPARPSCSCQVCPGTLRSRSEYA